MTKKQTINTNDIHRWVEFLKQLQNTHTNKGDQTTLLAIIANLKQSIKSTQCIGKSQLAARYQLCRTSFMNRLIQDEELYDYLILAGYKKRQKIFTPKQIEIIEKHFG